MIREQIQAAQTAAMKAGDKDTLGAVRLMLAAIKNRDIEARTGKGASDDDALVVEVLQKMVKQRRESVVLYRQGERHDLAEKELAELEMIERFLPQLLGDDELAAIVTELKAEVGATSVKDMGRVMALLKDRHGTRLDMAKASGAVKAALA